MSVLSRLSTLLKSNLNDLVDGMQDPAKEFDQLVRDLEESAREARGEVAAALADEKRLVKQQERLRDEAGEWEARAEQALRVGDEALARAALVRKAEKDAEQAELARALQEQKVHVDQLVAALKALDARVEQVKLRQGTLRERARAARGPGASPLSGQTKAFRDFDRMAHKIDAMEAAAGLDDALDPGAAARREADARLATLAEEARLDEALAALKKKLDG